MIFKEFGSKNRPAVVFLHGGGLSWWSWQPQIDALQKHYRILVPVIDGHGEDHAHAFVSIENSAEQVIAYIKENCQGRVYALCGLSIGAQIVIEIIARESTIAENAVIESALVYPMKMIVALTVPIYHLTYWLIKLRWFAKRQAKALHIPDELFDAYYQDSSRMSKKSLINLTVSNGHYQMPAGLAKTKAKTLILVGEKELSAMKKSATLLQETIPNSVVKVMKKNRHGETSLRYPDQYLQILQKSFQLSLSK